MIMGIAILFLVLIGIYCYCCRILAEFPLGKHIPPSLSFHMVFVGLTHPQLLWIHVTQVKANLPFYLPRSGVAM